MLNIPCLRVASECSIGKADRIRRSQYENFYCLQRYYMIKTNDTLLLRYFVSLLYANIIYGRQCFII